MMLLVYFEAIVLTAYFVFVLRSVDFDPVEF